MDLASPSNAINITVNSSSNVFWTIVSGVLIFAVGQVFVEAVIKPWQKYRELRSKISYSLVLYARYYCNPVETATFLRMKESDRAIEIQASGDKLRELASELAGFAEAGWPFGSSKLRIQEAVSNLIGLSNGLVSPHPDIAVEQNNERVQRIRELLKLRIKDI